MGIKDKMIKRLEKEYRTLEDTLLTESLSKEELLDILERMKDINSDLDDLTSLSDSDLDLARGIILSELIVDG